MAELLGILLIFGVVAFSFALMYKKRRWIAKWLENPEFTYETDPRTKAKRLRREIEDAQDKLEIIELVNNLEE